MHIPGNLLTTAMAVMPHTDVARALDILSLDVYTNAQIFASYAPSIRRFLVRDKIIVWGIVPTGLPYLDRVPQRLRNRFIESIAQRYPAKVSARR